MKRILSANHVDVLARFASGRAFVAFDYDGTLAPIVEDRERAYMRDRTRDLLERVASLYPCAVISGRGRDDVLTRLDGIAVKYVIGNHGLEPTEPMGVFEHEIAAIVPELREALREQHGVDIEDKRFSLAIHYRGARNKQQARSAIHAAISGLSRPMREVLGKLVVNAIPKNAPHKGNALVTLREQEGADIALYVGDDVTDEDVFEMAEPGRLLCIRVGNSRKSAAPWYLRNQLEMDALLEELVALRTPTTK